MDADSLSFDLWITLWCCKHPVGYTETDKQGNVFKRTENGFTCLWNQPIEYVTVTGTITKGD